MQIHVGDGAVRLVELADDVAVLPAVQHEDFADVGSTEDVLVVLQGHKAPKTVLVNLVVESRTLLALPQVVEADLDQRQFTFP